MSGKLRIFMVDDHPLVREWMGNLLRLQADMEVCGEAGDPASALDAMRPLQPDLAVVDLTLGKGSGLQLIKDIRDQLPRTRVLVLSMHEELGFVERALRAGARGYVMKRESTTHLVNALRTVHRGGIYADAAVLAKLAEKLVGRPKSTAHAGMDLLSDRELDVFRRLGEGHSTKRIAKDCGVSPKTVQTYCARIKEKLAIDDAANLRTAAARWLSESQQSDDGQDGG